MRVRKGVTQGRWLDLASLANRPPIAIVPNTPQYARYVAAGNDSKMQVLRREVGIPFQVVHQLNRVLSHNGAIPKTVDPYVRDVLSFYAMRDLGAVLMHVMKQQRFQIQGYVAMEIPVCSHECKWTYAWSWWYLKSPAIIGSNLELPPGFQAHLRMGWRGKDPKIVQKMFFLVWNDVGGLFFRSSNATHPIGGGSNLMLKMYRNFKGFPFVIVHWVGFVL